MKNNYRAFLKSLTGLLLALIIILNNNMYVNATGSVTSGYNGQAMYNEVTSEGWSYPADNIGKIYGAEAKAAYLNAVLTGDYTAFRTMIGVWKPVCEIPGVNIKADGTSYLNSEVGSAQRVESKTFYICGKYGTAADLYAYAAQYGYDLNDAKQMNDFGLAVRLWKTIPYPTQKKAPAKAATTTTTAASDKKVEALKTFKGNNSEFNAYNYYTRYPDLQSAFGPNGDALKKHYNEFGKGEGRNAK